MADNENKTEQPSERRLTEARERGQFARVPEFQAIAALFGALAVMVFGGKEIARRVAEIGIQTFGHLDQYRVTADRMEEWVKIGCFGIMGLGLPVLAGAAVAGALAGAIQSRFELSPKALEPDWTRTDPVQGWKRIASRDGAVRLLVDSLKLGFVGWLLWGAIQRIMGDSLFHSEVGASRLGGFIFDTTMSLILRFGLALAAIGAVHYLYQFSRVKRNLMMSREELKEENRSAEGDPMLRAMRRQLARRLLQKQMLAAIPQADVVVTNPTHYAVALKYERDVDQAPIVLAKGENAFAQRIKGIAREHDVPMMENKPVARMLFKYGRVGETIPMQLYQAVAEILGLVYRTHRYYFHELKQRRLAGERS